MGKRENSVKRASCVVLFILFFFSVFMVGHGVGQVEVKVLRQENKLLENLLSDKVKVECRVCLDTAFRYASTNLEK